MPIGDEMRCRERDRADVVAVDHRDQHGPDHQPDVKRADAVLIEELRHLHLRSAPWRDRALSLDGHCFLRQAFVAAQGKADGPPGTAQRYCGGLIPIITGRVLAAEGVHDAYIYVGGMVMIYTVLAIVAIIRTPETTPRRAAS
jgi:hypothetical protein